MSNNQQIDDYYLDDDNWSNSSQANTSPKIKKIIAKKIILKKKPSQDEAIIGSLDTHSNKKEEEEAREKIPKKVKAFVAPISKIKPPEKRIGGSALHKKISSPSEERPQKANAHFSNQPVSQNNKNFKSDDKKSTWFKKSFPPKQKSRFSEWDDASKRVFKKDKSGKYGKKFILDDEEDFSFSRSTKIKLESKEKKRVEDIIQNLTDHTGQTIIIPEILSVKELSEKTWISLVKLIPEFLKNGMKVTLNSKVDFETASIVIDTFQIKLQKDISSGFSVEDVISGDISQLLIEDDSSLLMDRAPVISIMGHVDHGKTSLLDYLRKTKIADKEAWGITQKIGAYQVDYNDKKITFLDTPGHEAFTMMRARGAKSTDIAILVVAWDEWVKPQTVESINHAKQADLKIIVAVTKMDKPWVNMDHVKSWLSSYGVLPEDWGGDVPIIWVSSKTWEWIDDLLEMILLVAEISKFKANPNRFAVGTVLESHLDTKLGPVSTVLINTGTLKKWDAIVSKDSYWKVKLLKSDLWKNIDEVTPSMPALVVGLDRVLEWWDVIQVVSDIEKARIKAIEFRDIISAKQSQSQSSLESIVSKIKSWSLKQLKLVLKSNSNGSLEAIKWSLLKLSTLDTKVSIIHQWVWNITEWDVLMAGWSQALLIGFWVEVLPNVQWTIDAMKVEYISSKVIYHITEKIEKIITWMLNTKEVETSLWESSIKWIFYEWKWFMVLGLQVWPTSRVEPKTKARIIRKDKYLGTWEIENVKSGIVDVNEIIGPVECGIKLKTEVLLELWDVLEIYKVELKK